MHPYCVFQHRVVVVEEYVHGFRMSCKDASFDFIEFTVRVIMGVPPGPAVNPLVYNHVAHHGCWQLWGVDAYQEDPMVFPPGSDFIGKQRGMSEFNRELFCACVADELFKLVKIGKRRWELEEIVMDMILKRCEELFEPLETLFRLRGEFLEMRNGAMYFDDPGKVLPFRSPGSHHVWVGEPVEAHVEFNRIETRMLNVPVQGVALVPGVRPA